MVKQLQEHKFNILNTAKYPSSIIPLITGTPQETIRFYTKLVKEHKIYALPVRYPAVPEKLGRLRIIVNSEHTNKEMDRLVKALVVVRKELK